MIIQQFADGVAFLADRSPIFGDKPLDVTLIANPKAGGFTRSKIYARHMDEIRILSERASTVPQRRAPTVFRLCPTGYPGHATETTRALIEESNAHPEYERLLILAGGDGTTLEVLSTLMDASEVERSRFVVLRLPLGTGNDGADSRVLLEALALLAGPSRFDRQRAIRVSPASSGSLGGKGPWWSFNIASIGVDAFITHMTNRLKVTFPGDSYKLWVNLASVFYRSLWPTKDFTIRAFDGSGREVRNFRKDMLLVAMGESGRRTYGSNKLILPDDDNVCFLQDMPLSRIVALKGPMMKGKHRGVPETDLFTASRLEIGFPERALVQMDGEAFELGQEDSPTVFELTEPAIRVIRKADVR
jgi:diacylglycerol kinase family enzyme